MSQKFMRRRRMIKGRHLQERDALDIGVFSPDFAQTGVAASRLFRRAHLLGHTCVKFF
jgi:hypothetical protein